MEVIELLLLKGYPFTLRLLEIIMSAVNISFYELTVVSCR